MIQQPETRGNLVAVGKGAVGTDPFHPRGAVIGSYRGLPIHDTLTVDSVTYRYEGIALEVNGSIDLRQLESGAMVVAPGLIYRSTK